MQSTKDLFITLFYYMIIPASFMAAIISASLSKQPLVSFVSNFVLVGTLMILSTAVFPYLPLSEARVSNQ